MMEIGYRKRFRSLGAILVLLPPSTVKPITWEWSPFEDILVETMENSPKGVGAPREPHGGRTGPK